VRALFDADSSENGHEQDGEAAQILDRVLTIASSVLHCAAAELHAKSDAESVGSWTSLSHVELMLALENEFSFKFKPREIMQFRSLGDAVAIVEQNRDVA
jgi:acyl carrier protein